MKHWLGWTLLCIAGAAFYIILESWWKGLLLVLGSILIDVGVDMILLKYEKLRGKID